MEYNIHGGANTVTGDVEWMEVHGGVVHVKGKVIRLVHTGGVIYDQRVEYKDRMSAKERDGYKRQIDELKRRLSKSEGECLMLREKLDKEEAKIPSDDVLVARIESLQNELTKERAERKREVEDLKERIDVAMEINATLRRETDRDRISQEIADRHVDILASLMALYPFTPDKDLVLEFNIPAERIREIARVLGVIKSTEARHEAKEYLRRQHIEFIQRRGGDQGKHGEKPVEQISKRGKVMASFASAIEAAKATGYCERTVRTYCRHKKKIFTKEGFTFRYKDNENQNS